MLTVIVAPDKFAGSLSAAEVAAAVVAGWRSVRPGDRLLTVPMSDGGPGFVAALSSSVGGAVHETTVTGPMGRPVVARSLVVGDTWYLESAQAAGLALVPPGDRDPLRATTRGVGELLRSALDNGARRVVVGLGGSATNDGGAGLLAALGAVARDDRGDLVALDEGPQGLHRIHTLDLTEPLERVSTAEIVVASDVDNPLLGPEGATGMFAPQKGAGVDDLGRLEAALAHWANCCAAAGITPQDAAAPGAGAAGGLGYGLLVLGGRFEPGIDLVVAATGLAEKCRGAGLVITGEGSLDEQSLHGKVVAGVVRAAGVTPVAALVGRCRLTVDQITAAGLSQVLSVLDRAAGIDDAMTRAADHVADLARELAAEVTAAEVSRG
ncbi:MAG: glycerate kinase [Candidatus Nanopelagicales bacterium]